ncbi:MAG: hypothetical protein M1365_02865, partial [Actinobacteria bacterium]|nr:hypothetical protein [Actinomycetota bacterium]
MMETPAEHTLPYNKDAIGIAYDRKSERIEGIQIPFRTLPDAIKLATRYWVETHPQDPELYSQI